MMESLQGLLTSQQFYVLELSKGRSPEKLPSSAWKWIWDIPLLTEENMGFEQYADFGIQLLKKQETLWDNVQIIKLKKELSSDDISYPFTIKTLLSKAW